MPATECANPLLLTWVKEWLDVARERNSKGVQVYKKAYDSLKSCPLPFSHPSEAQQLHGFGPKLCERLTDKLKAYCEENGLPMPELPHKARKRSAKDKDGDDDETEDAPVKKPRKIKAYVPTLRSGAYAIIWALSSVNEDSTTGLTKSEITEIAQSHCDSSFDAPSDPTKFYTAWNSMKTLIGKDLVIEKGRPLRRYHLTDEGWECATRIRQAAGSEGRCVTKATVPERLDDGGFVDIDGSPPPQARPRYEPQTDLAQNTDLIPVGTVVSDERSLPTFTPLSVPPGSFTVELVLDIREIRATKDRDYMQNELIKREVKPIMRALELGDILWIAKVKDPNLLTRLGCEGEELILDYVVERKRLDDLVSSIKDGRFHEQKFRLRKSGIKNVIYIVEEISMSNSDSFGRYEEAVESAIASMQVVDGYFVKKTSKMDDTIRYLARMTGILKELYEGKPLNIIPTRVLTSQNFMPLIKSLREKSPDQGHYITYAAFASLASKSESLTLRDVYLKMLMCTRGVTGEKALEIQRRWKTPAEFVAAFRACGSGEDGLKRKRALVESKMGSLVGRKKIGKAVSGKIAEVWGDA